MHPTKLALLTAMLVALGLGAARALPLPAPPQPSAGLPERSALVPPLLVRDGVAPADPAVADALPPYLQSRSAHFVDWLSDGSLLIATRFGDTEQIHRVRSPLGMREQLTFAAGGVIAAAARPFSSDSLAYLASHAGGGTRLYLLQLGATPALRALTDDSYRDGAPVWAPDGSRLGFVSHRRNDADADVYVLDMRTPGAAPQLLVAGNGARWRIFGWSADARQLLLGRALPTQPSAAALYLADVQSATVTPVSAPTGAQWARARRRRAPEADASASAAPLTVAAARFASDGSGIVLLTHAPAPPRAAAGTGSEYLHLVYLNPGDGRWQELSAPSAHDVRLFAQSQDGHYLAYTLDEDGASQLMLVDQQLRLQQPVSAVPSGVISSLKFDTTGKHLALTLESSRSPADVYVLDTGLGTLTRWTHSEVGMLDTQAFVEPQLLHFPTWDRPDGQDRELLALVYNPLHSIGAGAARPVVIWLCSGAGEQCRPRFVPFVQYLVQRLGCVVIAPEVRGSSGLGAALQMAGEGPLQDDAVRDVGSLLAWIGVQPSLDRSRVALLGEGFGSYLALESLTRYGDRLLGAVAAFPPALAGLANVVAIERPVLLVQGLDNWAVPAYEAAQLREGLRAQGVDVQYLAAPDEASDFTRKSARDAYHIAAASFLARLLLATG